MKREVIISDLSSESARNVIKLNTYMKKVTGCKTVFVQQW